MKIAPTVKSFASHHLLVFILGVFIVAAAVVAAPYSVRSSASPTGPSGNNKLSGTPTKQGQFDLLTASRYARLSSSTNFLLPVPQATETIATYDSTCLIPKTTFELGETVCARATGLVGFRFAWVDAAGYVEKRTPITTDPQEDTFVLPMTQTSELEGIGTVDNRGEWRVNAITNRGSARTSTFFTVKDPENPVVDLSITKSLLGDNPQENGIVQYEVILINNGPDDAANTRFQDNTFTGATYNSVTQTEGLPFICTGSESADCSIALFPKGEKAKFLVNFTAGSAGSDLQNTASVSSDTTEQNSLDNSFTTGSVKVGSGAAPPACSLQCPNNINAQANTEENGQRGAHVNYPPPTSDGTCGTVTSEPASGSFFPVGTTTVTATSSEGNGSCSFTVTVFDEGNPPTISCPANQTTNADSNCEATVAVGNPTVSGGENVTVVGMRSDGKPMYDCDQNGENCVRKSQDLPFAAGVTTITWIATSHDSQGNESGNASCTHTVTVNDVTPPVITATDETVSADANCQAEVPDYSNTVSDNCACSSSDESEDCQGHPHFTVTQSPAPGTIVGPGSHTVHIVANDGSSNNNGAGNTTEKTITLTVNDTTAPTVTAPADSSASADANCQAPVPDYTANSTASDNCDSSLTLTQSPEAGTLVTAGAHTVTVTATDDAGNQSSDDVVFTVNDTTPPTVQAPADSSASADANCQAPVPDYTANSTASDTCDSSVTLTQSPAAGTLVSLGSHTVTVTATDDAGNQSSDDVVFTVNDTTGPTVHAPADSSASADANCMAPIPDYVANSTASDNCDSTLTLTQSPAAGTMVSLGAHTVTVSTTDDSGNTGSDQVVFTVYDTTAPTITTNGLSPMLWPANHNYHTFNVTDFVIAVGDNCDSLGVSNVVIQQVTSDEPENGGGDGNTFDDIVIAADCKSVQLRAERQNSADGRVYTITFKVTDASGNVGTKTSTVTVPKNLGVPVVNSGVGYTKVSNCP